jgi:hypothetical protein
MSRSRPLLAAALAATVTVTVPGAGQAAETAYRITVDTAATGPAISEHMYGVFFEDINRAAEPRALRRAGAEPLLRVRPRRQRPPTPR